MKSLIIIVTVIWIGIVGTCICIQRDKAKTTLLEVAVTNAVAPEGSVFTNTNGNQHVRTTNEWGSLVDSKFVAINNQIQASLAIRDAKVANTAVYLGGALIWLAVRIKPDAFTNSTQAGEFALGMWQWDLSNTNGSREFQVRAFDAEVLRRLNK